MNVVTFEVKSHLAQFRRPDATATHMTYPFITPTAAKGLVGAILGHEDFQTTDRVAIQLLRPVQTRAQQLSMLGKEKDFNRPTTVEYLIRPHYKIWYTGEQYTGELWSRLSKEQAIYQPYLGVAYALTKPFHCEKIKAIQWNSEEATEVRSVVPTTGIRHINLRDERNRYLARANGFPRYYQGGRTFSHSVDFLYSPTCEPLFVTPLLDESLTWLRTDKGDALCFV